MPYITCPDGKTYSRYDQSEYVKWCICDEKLKHDQQFKACMEDPKCKHEYEFKQKSANIIIFSLFLMTCVIFYKLFKGERK